jgi:hypothetical protein
VEEDIMAGYSGTPLTRKLGLKDGQTALLIGVPGHLGAITDFPGFVSRATSLPAAGGGPFDYVHLFVTERAHLETGLPAIRKAMRRDAAFWISWPKKASKVKTDITDDVLRTICLPTGLVDVKVCAVDDVWSALKFVIRKELRNV